MTSAVGSLEALRQQNRRRVLQVLQAQGRTSRADIARTTGLSRSAVSSLVAELLAERQVVEDPVPSRDAVPAGGRPPRMLSLDPRSGAFLGVRLGHADVRLVLLDRAGHLLGSRREATDRPWSDPRTAEQVLVATTGLLEAGGMTPASLLGAGLALSAPLPDPATESALRPLTDALSAELGVVVRAGNDANLGALAEARFGAARGVADVLYVMLSAGVGGALLLGGRLYEGAHGTAGELGHVVVRADGDPCRCGNRGCLETVAGVAGLLAPLQAVHGPGLDLDGLVRLLDAGDPAAHALVHEAGRAVGRAVGGLCSVLDPGLVVLGGDLVPLGRPLLDGVQAALDDAVRPGASYPLRAGELGVDAEALGAAALVLGHDLPLR